MSRAYLAFLPIPLLVACPSTDESTTKLDDSGTTDTQVHYDEGCITVDGAGGYAHLQDAVTVATDGATIALCDGTYEESVTVDKAVTIVGASRDGVFVEAQGTDPAFRIAAGASVSTLTVRSTYTGIIVDGATGADVHDVTFDTVAYWGLQASNATGTTVSDSTITQPGGGGVQVSGGSATLAGLTIDNPTGFGIQALNGADLTVTGTTLSGILMTSEDVTDGYAFNVMDSSLTTDGNVVNGAEGVGIWAEGATLDLSNDTIDAAGFLGVYAYDTAVTMSTVALTNSALAGAYVVGSSFVGDGVTATTTPEGSCSYPYAQWGTDNYGPWCGGLLIVADGITLTNSAVSGWNNFGVLLQGNTDLTSPISVDGLTISDTGRWGLNLYEPNATVTGLTITGMREPEMPAPCQDSKYIYLDRSVGLLLQGGNLTLTDSDISGNGSWGISVVQGQLDASGSTFDTNSCSSVLNYQGAAHLTANTFSGGWSNGNVWDYQAATIVEGNHFVGNHYTYVGSYEYDGSTYSYTYSGYGLDIYSYSSSSLEVTGNVFEDGDQSVSLYLSEADIHDNSWTGYDGEILYSYQSASPVRFANNAVDDFGGYLALSYYGEVELEDVEVGSQRASTVYYENYQDGVLTSSGSYTSQAPTIYAYGTADMPTSVSVDGLEMQEAPFGFLSAYDTNIELYDVHIGSVGAGSGSTMVNATWQSVDPVATLEGVGADTASGSGVYLYTSTTGPSYVDMHDLTFGTVAGSAAVSVYYLRDWSLVDSDLGEAGSYGVYAYANSTTPGTATVSNVQVRGGDAYGFYLYGGTVDLQGSTGTTSGSGLWLQGATATVTGNVFTTNSQYGMVCGSTTLTQCSDNDLSGNGMGEHQGCDDGCAGGSGGGDDTGA